MVNEYLMSISLKRLALGSYFWKKYVPNNVCLKDDRITTSTLHAKKKKQINLDCGTTRTGSVFPFLMNLSFMTPMYDSVAKATPPCLMKLWIITPEVSPSISLEIWRGIRLGLVLRVLQMDPHLSVGV